VMFEPAKLEILTARTPHNPGPSGRPRYSEKGVNDMNSLQNILAKSTIVAVVALFFGLTVPARAELTLNVQGVFSSPDTAIRQGDSATFSVTVSVEGDLPADEHVAADYFELYWSINRTSDSVCVYSLGPTTATSISYTFDEGEAYTILCAVSYYYKLDGEDEYTRLWTEAEGHKDVVKVTGISLRASGAAKTIGDAWVKDDWDITTVPAGYRDLVDLPDHTIATHLHTVTAMCGTSHADYQYVGIQFTRSWTTSIGPDDGPDDFTYTLMLEGADGTYGIDYSSMDGEGGITGGVTSGSLTDGAPLTDMVNVASSNDFFGGAGGGYASLQNCRPNELIAGQSPDLTRNPLRPDSNTTETLAVPADAGDPAETAKRETMAGITSLVTSVIHKIFKFIGENTVGYADGGYPDPGQHANSFRSEVHTYEEQVIAPRDLTKYPIPGVSNVPPFTARISINPASGYSFRALHGWVHYAVDVQGTALLKWDKYQYGHDYNGNVFPDGLHTGYGRVEIQYDGSATTTASTPETGYALATAFTDKTLSVSISNGGTRKDPHGTVTLTASCALRADPSTEPLDMFSVSNTGGSNPKPKVYFY